MDKKCVRAGIVLHLVIRWLLDSEAQKKKPYLTLTVLLPAINCVSADQQSIVSTQTTTPPHAKISRLPHSSGDAEERRSVSKESPQTLLLPHHHPGKPPGGMEEGERNIEAVNGYHWRSDTANSIRRFGDIAQGGIERFE